MMKNDSSQYLSSASSVSQKSPFTFVKFIASVLVALVLGVFFAGSAVSVAKVKEAEAFDWTQWIMCEVMPDPSKQLYQYSQSSDMQYQLRSKSTMNSGVADVDSGLNWILDLFGPGFEKVNEGVLGFELDPVQPEDVDLNKQSESFNAGTKVNVFDRFGVAGMGFNSYQGEWKHILIDACNTDAEPMDPKAGLYYEERLEPRSTWEYVSTSHDPRTVQFDRGIFIHYWTSIVNVVANSVFWITKVMVVVTIALISFSLSDIVDVLGINDLLGSENGIFTILFDGIFQPLIFLAFIGTAFKIFWDGIVKRQYRASLITLLRSLFMFLMAFIVAANPAFWMSLPNNIAVVGQSIILTTLSGNLPNSGGLCDTDIGRFKVGIQSKDVTDTEKNIDLLAQSAESMRSAVSCQFWQAFLFRPWVQGQFGTDWKLLWAEDSIPNWVDKEDSAELNNLNSEMVGNAAVPLGDGEFINNWAIYQLSTQTNVHSATGEDKQGKPSKYTSGVANDWWRIVDALSNYEEETKEVELIVGTSIGGGGSTTTSGEYAFPIANPSKSSDFGMRTHPVTGARTLHAGIDYSAPTGTPLYAVADGTVQTSRSSTGGNIIELKGVDGWTYRYLHLSAYVASNGQQVTAGQEIGKVGATGRVTGAHLHFETRSASNEKIDPNIRLREMGFDPATGSGSGASQTINPGAGTGTTSKQPYEYGVPKNNPVTPYWDTWVGNNSFGRIWASLLSILIAGVGLAAPLVLSAMSAIYSLGVAILMAFAPIFLLIGCWGGRGWELFKGWGELVINTTLKRIIVGLLLALTISFTVTAIDMIDEVGWFEGMIILVLLSLLILNSRKKMVDTLASIKFASVDFSGTANRIGGIAKQQTIGRAQTFAKDSGRMSASVAAGAIGSKYAGGTLREGASAGLKNELKNLTYRKQSLSHARISYENFKVHGTDQAGENSEEARIFAGTEQCNACGKTLAYESEQNGTHLFYGGRTVEGNLLCQECYDDGAGTKDGQEAYSVQHRYNPVYAKKAAEEQNKIKDQERNKEAQSLYTKAMTGKTSYVTDNPNKKSYTDEIQEDLINDTYSIKRKIKDPETNKITDVKVSRSLNDDLRTEKLVNLIAAAKRDINMFSKNNVDIPPIPEFLTPYISESRVRAAWGTENYSDVIIAMYTAGALNWFNDNVRDLDGEENPRNLNLGEPNDEYQNLLLKVQEKKIK